MSSPKRPDGSISRAVREVLDLAADPRFPRRAELIRGTGGCSNPVHLIGRSSTVDTTTGEIVHTYTTEDEPGGRLLVACGNRRASRCETCSQTYRTDTFHLIRSGLSGGKSVPEEVREHPRVFLTLTAPSFGPVHNRPTAPTGRRLDCRCGLRHAEDAPELGTAVHPYTYDYDGAALWNAHAGALWARFTTTLRRRIAASAGLTQKGLASQVRVSFAKVAEYQRRGLVHFHAVIRLDGPDRHNITPPPAWADIDLLTDAIRDAVRLTALPFTADGMTVRDLRWGAQVDVRPIAAFGTGQLTDRAVAAYIAKYATKGAESSGTVDRSLCCRACSGSGCDLCSGTGLAESLDRLRVDEHTRRMIRACWRLGALPELEHLHLRKWAHMLGFRGHFSTKSRRYSVTLTALRAARTDWRAEERRRLNGWPDPAERPTTTEATWRFAGTGYSPGETLIAAAVRRDLDLNRQASAWERAA